MKERGEVRGFIYLSRPLPRLLVPGRPQTHRSICLRSSPPPEPCKSPQSPISGAVIAGQRCVHPKHTPKTIDPHAFCPQNQRRVTTKNKTSYSPNDLSLYQLDQHVALRLRGAEMALRESLEALLPCRAVKQIISDFH
jgi:hypothetical protein